MAGEPETTPILAPSPPSTSSEKSSGANFAPQPQVPFSPNFPFFSGGGMQMFPIMYPAVTPGISSQNPDESNSGSGLYAVPVGPYMRPVAGLHSDTLVPFTYNIPTRQSSEAVASGDGQEQVGQQQQQPPREGQVVDRRFEIAIQLDLLLILKLAALVFLLHNDGSRQKLVVLIFFALLFYLYEIGALDSLIRWLSQGTNGPAAPHPPRADAAAVAENVPLAEAGQANDNANIPAEGQVGDENENLAADDANQVAEDVNAAEVDADNGADRLQGIVREIEMVVFGFIASLLPGFENVD